MAVTIPEHLKERANYLNSLTANNLPDPWKLIATIAVGGLTDVGFHHSSDLLLLVSNTRGLVDCTTGEVQSMDRNANFAFDTANLEVDGIGSLEGQKIRVSGLHGGGLAKSCTGGWSIDRNPTAWPQEQLFLFPDWETLWSVNKAKTSHAVKIGGFDELRAFGFSPTGKSLVVATSSEVTIYGR